MTRAKYAREKVSLIRLAKNRMISFGVFMHRASSYCTPCRLMQDLFSGRKQYGNMIFLMKIACLCLKKHGRLRCLFLIIIAPTVCVSCKDSTAEVQSRVSGSKQAPRNKGSYKPILEEFVATIQLSLHNIDSFELENSVNLYRKTHPYQSQKRPILFLYF